jgi:hypothetical protein
MTDQAEDQTIEFSQEQWADLEAAARAEGVSVDRLVCGWLEEYVREEG